jgi:hypothetical protein
MRGRRPRIALFIMSYSFAPDHYAVAMDERAIALDIAADRYRLLGAPAGTALRALDAGDPDHPGIKVLTAMGVLVHGGGLETKAWPDISSSAIEHERIEQVPLGFGTVAVGLLRSIVDLRSIGLKAVLQAARIRTIDAEPNRQSLIPIAQAYVRHRSRLPLKRICLPDSLALHRILCAKGLGSTLVVGVRLDPFMAHCWLQAGDMVLNDSCDHVCAYKPILRI